MHQIGEAAALRDRVPAGACAKWRLPINHASDYAYERALGCAGVSCFAHRLHSVLSALEC